MWQQVAARLPKEPDQPFELTITEDELTQLVLEEAAQSVEVEYEGLAIEIQGRRVVVTMLAEFQTLGTRLDIAAEGVPIIVDGQVRFQINKLDMQDRFFPLTEWLTLSLTNTLNRGLYFLQPTQKAHIRSASFHATTIQLQEGAMIIEGFTR